MKAYYLLNIFNGKKKKRKIRQQKYEPFSVNRTDISGSSTLLFLMSLSHLQHNSEYTSNSPD